MSRSESRSILHPGFVNIHQDSYRKHCTSLPQEPHLLDQNPQYLHSHHNKYKCQPDSPYPKILGQCSPIFYKPWASPDLISAPTWGGHEQFSHPRCSPHYAEKDLHISRKDNYQTALYNLKQSPEMTETENIMTPDQAVAQMQILYHIKISMCLIPVHQALLLCTH